MRRIFYEIQFANLIHRRKLEKTLSIVRIATYLKEGKKLIFHYEVTKDLDNVLSLTYVCQIWLNIY
jgi:hypothetical protein